MPSIEWVSPAPLWATPQSDFKKPWLAEFAGDDFLPDFLALMGDRVAGKSAADLRDTTPEVVGGGTLKLYQPLHGRYYLVTGSLVCRQVGLPNRTVARQDGERTFFVLRRWLTVNGQPKEQGWVNEGPNKGWQFLVDERGQPVSVRPDEERLPLHPVPVCLTGLGQALLKLPNGNGDGQSGAALPPAALVQQGERTVYYGYIPVDSRERRLTPIPNPALALQNLLDSPQSSSAIKADDPRISELMQRVLFPWHRLYINPANGQPWTPTAAENWPLIKPAQRQSLSLYLLLDLLDFLKNNLPTLYGALDPNAPALLAGSQRAALLAELKAIRVTVGGGWLSLAAALHGLKPVEELVDGQGTEPQTLYNVRDADRPDPNNVNARLTFLSQPAYLQANGSLFTRFYNALKEEKEARQAAGQPWLSVPPEIADMLKVDPDNPASGAGGGNEQLYHIRLVYEHAPCAPVVSRPSAPLIFAKMFDPDAPARHIRIELPDIKNLRRFKRGVGMETNPDLRKLMDQIHKGMLDGEGLGPEGAGWELGMICSFSIQIIFLVAFLVMFIFLIAFNFIFWWLPFLRICFPVPVKK